MTVPARWLSKMPTQYERLALVLCLKAERRSRDLCSRGYSTWWGLKVRVRIGGQGLGVRG